MDNIEQYLGKRIVLTSNNEIAYAGVPITKMRVNSKEGLILQLDDESGFSIWCPDDFIKDILVIPIPTSYDDIK